MALSAAGPMAYRGEAKSQNEITGDRQAGRPGYTDSMLCALLALQPRVPTNLGHVYYRTDQRSETRVWFPWAETLDPGQCFLLRVRGGTSSTSQPAGGILHPLLLALWATSEPSTSTSLHGLLLCLWLGGPRVYLRAHLDKARTSPTSSP